LKFSLFEGVKHEADADLGKPFVHPPPTNSKYTPPVRHESMSNRLEVQSVPFQVFSAKKFPGLNMSTSLSKLVAEQGCRVRIRRDIRQRKRTQKADGDAEDAHSSYQGTPQAAYRALDHSRSASRNSIGSQYEADAARRASVESIYRQPTIQSRQPSIGGMPLGSPGLPNPSQMATSMPPPPPAFSQNALARPPLETSPLPSPYTPTQMSAPMSFPKSSPIHPESSRPVYTTELENNGPTLPPLRGFPRPLYALNDSQPTKRSASSRTYDAEASLKDRQRPDTRRFPAVQGHIYWSPDSSVQGANQVIEPDTGDCEEEDDTDTVSLAGPMIYERADGSKQNKWSRLIWGLLIWFRSSHVACLWRFIFDNDDTDLTMNIPFQQSLLNFLRMDVPSLCVVLAAKRRTLNLFPRIFDLQQVFLSEYWDIQNHQTLWRYDATW
jgi:hypothetical protein